MPVMRIVEKGLNMKSSTLHDGIFFIAGLVVAMCMSGSAVAQEATIGKILSAPTSETGRPARSDFDVPAGQLAIALDVFGKQGGIELHYRFELVANTPARAVTSQMSWQEALDRLLQGTGHDGTRG